MLPYNLPWWFPGTWRHSRHSFACLECPSLSRQSYWAPGCCASGWSLGEVGIQTARYVSEGPRNVVVPEQTHTEPRTATHWAKLLYCTSQDSSNRLHSCDQVIQHLDPLLWTCRFPPPPRAAWSWWSDGGLAGNQSESVCSLSPGPCHHWPVASRMHSSPWETPTSGLLERQSSGGRRTGKSGGLTLDQYRVCQSSAASAVRLSLVWSQNKAPPWLLRAVPPPYLQHIHEKVHYKKHYPKNIDVNILTNLFKQKILLIFFLL